MLASTKPFKDFQTSNLITIEVGRTRKVNRVRYRSPRSIGAWKMEAGYGSGLMAASARCFTQAQSKVAGRFNETKLPMPRVGPVQPSVSDCD